MVGKAPPTGPEILHGIPPLRGQEGAAASLEDRLQAARCASLLDDEGRISKVKQHGGPQGGRS